MGEVEVRLRLFELLWAHGSPMRITADLVNAIEEELLPWVMGSKTPHELWPDLIPPPPNTGKGEGV